MPWPAQLGDPLIAAQAAAVAAPRAPRALTFDPTTRDFTRDANGRYVDQHPVDAAVVTALLLQLGKLPAAPNVGAAFRSIGNALARDAQRKTERVVRKALARLIARGDITLVTVVREVRASGAHLIVVTYVNERLQGRPQRTATATFT